MKRTLRAAVAALAIGACLPNPQSVRERREGFDRSRYAGTLLLDAVPEGATPLGVQFEGQIELVAAKVEPPQPQRGERAQVTYYWRALREVARDFQVFVHGDALEGSYRRLSFDHWPARGKIPTGVWKPGEIVVDRFTVSVPSSYGPRRMALYSGLYKGDDRLRITEPGKVQATNDNRSLAVELSF